MERRTKNKERRTYVLSAAFTLLEVMVVIGIIAILVALMFPVIMGASTKAKQKQAMAETRTILMGLKAYRQEYGKWPIQWQSERDTTYIASNYLVIKTLLGSNVSVNGIGFNPKNKVFLHMQISSQRMDVLGNYLDPWLIPYVICMDENGDNKLTVTNTITYSATNVGQKIKSNISLNITNVTISADAGVGSMGGASNDLFGVPWNTWTEMR